MNTQPHETFFHYNLEREVEGKKVILNNGISFDSIERYHTDENGVLNLVMKSLTEGYREGTIVEGGKLVTKMIKVPMNVVVMIEKPEDVERFLATVQAV